MRKLFTVLAGLFLTAGAANAQVCYQFDNFCDAVQINGINERGVSAAWSSWDCAGSDAPMAGFLDGGRMTLVCSDATCPLAEDWAFALALPIQAFWLYNIDQGILFQSQSPYTPVAGACTNGPVNNGALSTISR